MPAIMDGVWRSCHRSSQCRHADPQRAKGSHPRTDPSARSPSALERSWGCGLLKTMRVDPCEERHALSLKLYVAVEAIYEAKERYASAKERKAASIADLRRMLAEARAIEH